MPTAVYLVQHDLLLGMLAFSRLDGMSWRVGLLVAWSWYTSACWAWDGWLACWACLGRAWYGRACWAGGGWPRAWAGALPKVQLPPTDTHLCHRRPARPAHFIFLTTSSTVSPFCNLFNPPPDLPGKCLEVDLVPWYPGPAANSKSILLNVASKANNKRVNDTKDILKLELCPMMPKAEE